VGSILLVESDPDTCDQWSTALGAAGHAVLAALAMREALPLIREGGIDVVVIDAYHHHVVHGIVELARGIEALPDAPPIVLISSSPDAPELSARIGAAAFLPKPCETDDIIEAVGGLLGRVRPVRTFEDEPTGPAGPRYPRTANGTEL
jgi:CheY-like chemotaxis protein